MTEEVLEIYIDTSALRAMSFAKDVATLLHLAKEGRLKVYLSETTLWERGRQQYEADYGPDKLIPVPKPYADCINRYLAWFKALFESHNVSIIPSDRDINELALAHLQNDQSYFSSENGNDQRDAHVLATAESKVAKNAVILCKDKQLAETFTDISGFENVVKKIKEFLQEISGSNFEAPKFAKPSLDSFNERQMAATFTDYFKDFISGADKRFVEYLNTLPEVTDKLTAKLANMQLQDADIRKRVLGYTQWFAPLSKAQLNELLEGRHYIPDHISSNTQRMIDEGFIIETENHYMTNKEDVEVVEICEQAMAVVMPEILEILGLD